MSTSKTPELTSDEFLGGQLRILQPAHGYRAGVDPVLLAAAVPAKPGDDVLEIGCGVGTALACLARRVSGLNLTGLEVQPDYVGLARRNAKANRLDIEVIEGDLNAPPGELKAQSFDHVMMNPPYWEADARTPAKNSGKETALSTEHGPRAWCDMALKRLKPNGILTMIHVPQFLPDALGALLGRASVVVHPIAPREGKDSNRFILIGRKGGRAPCVLAAPAILHQGATHDVNNGAYTAQVDAILRKGNAWGWDAN